MYLNYRRKAIRKSRNLRQINDPPHSKDEYIDFYFTFWILFSLFVLKLFGDKLPFKEMHCLDVHLNPLECLYKQTHTHTMNYSSTLHLYSICVLFLSTKSYSISHFELGVATKTAIKIINNKIQHSTRHFFCKSTFPWYIIWTLVLGKKSLF